MSSNITIWNETYPFEQITQFNCHNGTVILAKQIINNETRLISAAGGPDFSIKIWNASDPKYKLIYTIPNAHSQEILCLTILPNVNIFIF